MNIIEKVDNFIKTEHMLVNCNHIVAGVSGGADSICMLTILHELFGTKISIIYKG